MPTCSFLILSGHYHTPKTSSLALSNNSNSPKTKPKHFNFKARLAYLGQLSSQIANCARMIVQLTPLSVVAIIYCNISVNKKLDFFTGTARGQYHDWRAGDGRTASQLLHRTMSTNRFQRNEKRKRND